MGRDTLSFEDLVSEFYNGIQQWYERNGSYSTIVYPKKEAVIHGLKKILDKLD